MASFGSFGGGDLGGGGYGGGASSFGGGSGSSMMGSMPSKQQVMDQVRNEVAVANAQELLTKMTTICFEKCMTKPGSRLESSDESCLARCMDRYMDAWNVVAKAYATRVQSQR